MKKYIRKADIILFIALVVVGLACSIYLAMSKSGGDTVVINRNGELYAKYSLNEDRTVVVSDAGKASIKTSATTSGKASAKTSAKAESGNAGSSDDTENVVVIKDGSVYMKSATCHNQVCVHHEAISQTGESIVCLPNKVVVSIEGKGGGYDAVSR